MTPTRLEPEAPQRPAEITDDVRELLKDLVVIAEVRHARSLPKPKMQRGEVLHTL